MVETQFSKRIKIFQSNNALEYTQYAFQAILHSYGTIHQLICILMVPLSKMVELNKNFVILLTLFALSFSLPKFLLLFGAKLLFMLFMILIVFLVLLAKIKLHMSTFSGHFQTITTFTPSILPVLFFFSCMSITNLSLGLGFVVFLAMAKLKRGICVMILSLIVFISPAMLSFGFGNIAHLLSSLTYVPPYLHPPS